MEKADVRILVIDDVNTIRMHLKELLITAGYRKIRLLSTAEEAKAFLTLEEIHLILCDLHMSPLTGIDFLKFIKGSPSYKKIPFVMITAEATREMVMSTVVLGVDDYIVKPISLAHIDKISGLLKKKQVIQ